jgi:cell division protein FtsQ
MAHSVVTTLPLDVRLMNLASALLFAVGLVGLVWGAVALAARHSVFDIGGVSVVGDTTHNNAVTLRANTLPKLQGNFFTADLAQVRAAFEAAPWVRKALVQREFPNRLRVHLQEHQVAALWGADGESRLVNTYGEVFEANADEVEGDALPRLLGPDEQSAVVLRAYQTLLPLFARSSLSLEQLELSERGGWRARLDGQAKVEMGRGDVLELGQRVQRMVGTLEQVFKQYGRSVESIDLRYSQGYALKLRGVSTETSEQGSQNQR